MMVHTPLIEGPPFTSISIEYALNGDVSELDGSRHGKGPFMNRDLSGGHRKHYTYDAW